MGKKSKGKKKERGCGGEEGKGGGRVGWVR